MKNFFRWYYPEGFTKEEIRRWHERLDQLPEFVETFRLIREISAGHASMLTTILTRLETLDHRVQKVDNAYRDIIAQLIETHTVIADTREKVEKLSDLATVLILEREEKRNG